MDGRDSAIALFLLISDRSLDLQVELLRIRQYQNNEDAFAAWERFWPLSCHMLHVTCIVVNCYCGSCFWQYTDAFIKLCAMPISSAHALRRRILHIFRGSFLRFFYSTWTTLPWTYLGRPYTIPEFVTANHLRSVFSGRPGLVRNRMSIWTLGEHKGSPICSKKARIWHISPKLLSLRYTTYAPPPHTQDLIFPIVPDSQYCSPRVFRRQICSTLKRLTLTCMHQLKTWQRHRPNFGWINLYKETRANMFNAYPFIRDQFSHVTTAVSPLLMYIRQSSVHSCSEHALPAFHTEHLSCCATSFGAGMGNCL